MVRTYGLTHLALAVRDPERSYQFCRELFGVRELYRDAESIQVETPGAHDVIGLEKDPRKAGKIERDFAFRVSARQSERRECGRETGGGSGRPCPATGRVRPRRAVSLSRGSR